MARLKKFQSFYTQAVVRLAAIQSIDPKLDFGNELSVYSFANILGRLRSKLDEYNSMLSQMDELGNEAEAIEREVRDYHERMLTGVATRFGKNSNEYEMAGGVKKSERKRPSRRKDKVVL